MSRKVAGSIRDDVIGVFHWHNPSGCPVALGSTQLLTEMSNRNIFWGVKAAGFLELTALPNSCADCLEIWDPKLLELSGHVQASIRITLKECEQCHTKKFCVFTWDIDSAERLIILNRKDEIRLCSGWCGIYLTLEATSWLNVIVTIVFDSLWNFQTLPNVAKLFRTNRRPCIIGKQEDDDKIVVRGSFRR